MIVGGNKYACEACVRGHRVSNCQHVDRPLQQISKKGRPISQCQHCRVMRKSRSAHIKCDCGAPARNIMLEKQSVEGSKERCSCSEGGRCTCAYKKELPRMDAIPGGDSDKDSKTSAGSNGGRRRRAEGYCHNQVPADGTGQSRKSGPGQLNHARPTHSNTSLHNGSPNNILPGMSGGFPNGSLEGHGSHQEQGWVTTGTASPFLHSNPASSIHEFDNQLPILDLSTTIDSNFELFGGLLDAEQHKVNAWQSAINGDWRTHEFSAAAGYNQAQGFNSFDSCGSQQPPLSDTMTSTSARVPLTAAIDATSGDWWHSMPSLADPDIAPLASDVAPNITHINPVAVPNQPLISNIQHQMRPTYGIMSVTSSDRQFAPSGAHELRNGLEGDNSRFWG